MPATARPQSATTPDVAALAALRFPLLPRPKPMCRPLTDRIQRVRQQALNAQQNSSMDHAAMALNLAALIYSDCNMPDTARELCWQQFDVYTAHGPYDEPTAKTAVQPLINIGRLDTRAGHGAAAYNLHEAMFQAARNGTAATIDGRTINLGILARAGDAQRALVQALWMVLLADGLRALCRAGRWDRAREHARAHRGIGKTLLDGRQIAIIAAATHGDQAEARTLIDNADVTEPWERLTAASLRVLTMRFAGAADTADIDTMLNAYAALDPQPQHAVFLARSGLTVMQLAHGHSGADFVVNRIRALISEPFPS